MAETADNANPSAPRRVLSYPYTLLGVIFLIALAFPVFLRQAQDWETVYVPAAARLSDGSDIYQAEYVYPPINAWLALPFVDLPRLPTRALWYAINMTALSILVLGSWKLSGGGYLEGSAGVPWREHGIFWLGLGCGISSCLDALTNQQTDLIVAALVIVGCLALVRERNLWAAVSFGVAAAIKCTPLLFAPYLAWKKQWMASALVFVVAVGANLIPDVTHPPEGSSTRLVTWARRYLLPMADRKHDYGTWACGIGGNQSVAGLTQRWLTCDPIWENDSNLIGEVSESRVSPVTLKAVSWGAMLSLLAVGLACSWKGSGQLGTQSRVGIEFGMVLILMVLLSPHSSKPHFCTLFLPGFCVARAALSGPNRRLLTLLLIALACALASNCDLVGSWVYSWAKWHGSLAWCAGLLYAGSCWVLVKNGNAASDTVESEPVERREVRKAA
jgi:hypothetical protein